MTVFTEEELRELRAFDIEVDDSQITLEEWLESAELDKMLRCDEKRRRDREYYAANREKSLERSKAWQAAHKSWIREYQRKYRQEHYDERKLYDSTYYTENRDEILSRRRERYDERKDDINAKRREDRMENAEHVRARERDYWKSHASEINARRRERYRQRKEQQKTGVLGEY